MKTKERYIIKVDHENSIQLFEYFEKETFERHWKELKHLAPNKKERYATRVIPKI